MSLKSQPIIVLSEGNIGWMPYFIERAEQVVDKQRHWAKKMNIQLYKGSSGAESAGDVPQADLDTLDVRRRFREHIYGCFIEETADGPVLNPTDASS